MKIVFFMGSMGRGGAERVISILANHYAAKGWDVEIALLLENKIDYELNEKITCVDLTGKHLSYFKNLPGWLLGIRRYLKKTKPDKIVSFVGRINALVLMSTVGMNMPILVSERNDPKHDGRSASMLWICNQCYGFKRCKTIVYQTQYQASCFDERLSSKSCVIPNPIGVSAQRESEEAFRIVSVGRLIEQKNYPMLIDAVSRLKDLFPNLILEIYGEGHLKNSLQALINANGMGDRIILKGNASDLHHRIANAGIFVMTSEFEGLSNALLEAMMLGLPCVSTEYPGADEAIENGENGILVPCGNVEKLADAIQLLLLDDELRSRIANNALITAQRYRKKIVLKLWEDVIEG